MEARLEIGTPTGREGTREEAIGGMMDGGDLSIALRRGEDGRCMVMAEANDPVEPGVHRLVRCPPPLVCCHSTQHRQRTAH